MKNDGGSAFPHEADYHYQSSASCGMTMRDYFAASALAGVQMNKEVIRAADESGKTVAELIAGTAYFLADAMLAEREK